MEVNASFYRLPRRDSVARWVAESPEGFVFAIKVSRYLTHVKRLRETGEHLPRLLERIEPLLGSPKLGPLLWQLPGVQTRRRPPRRGTRRVPARSPSRDRVPARELVRRRRAGLLRASGVALVIADGPNVRSFQRHELTAGFTYVRLHAGARGRRGNYSQTELRGVGRPDRGLVQHTATCSSTSTTTGRASRPRTRPPSGKWSPARWRAVRCGEIRHRPGGCGAFARATVSRPSRTKAA